jgi:hypothetical protein
MTTPESSEGIEVTGRHNALAFFLYLIPLTVEVDGEAHPGPWGRQRFIAAPPGQHAVSVYFPYLWQRRCCEAKGTVQVAPGQVSKVTYDAPIFMFSPGKLSVG